MIDKRRLLFTVCFDVAVAWACYYAFRNAGSEADWYVIDRATDLTVGPPFRHRILFVLIAKAILAVAPSMTTMFAFQVTQGLACLLATVAMRKWCELVVGPSLAFAGQAVMAAALVTTFWYWTFYDIGVVFFAAACFACAVRGWLVPCAILFSLGTLNHEGILLVALDTAVLFWTRGMPRLRVLSWFGLLVVLYALMRAALFTVMPVDAAYQSMGIMRNLEIFHNGPGTLARFVLGFGLWCVTAALGWPYAPKWLKVITAVHVPQLAVVAVLFGKVNEVRLYNGFLPLHVALTLCFIKAMLAKEQPV